MKQRHSTETTGVRNIRSGGADQTKEIRDEIIDWLKDAYAMERGMEGSLEKHSRNDELSPEVRERAATHLEETRRHAEQVRSALQALGTDTSTLKTSLGVMAQGAKGLSSVLARDEAIKDLLDAYSMEHFEIACYTSLAAAAESAGLTEISALCLTILSDEQRMAQALIQAIPAETTAYLSESSRA
jgi:ferritin-like metal-binding protein YciE